MNRPHSSAPTGGVEQVRRRRRKREVIHASFHAFTHAPKVFACRRVICTYIERVAKDGRFYLRLTTEERAMYDEIAEALGAESASHAVRFVMREKYRELFGQPEERPSRLTKTKPRR